MANAMDERFAHENIPKLILSLAAPAIVAQLVNALYNVVDRMYIGRMPEVGTSALTGLGVAFPIIMVISAFAALVGYGGAPLSSIRMGEGRKDKAEELLGSCFSTLVLLAVVLTVTLLPIRDTLLRAFGASDQTLPFASDYLAIYLLGTISVQIALGMNQFISAQGFAKTAMLTVFMGAGLNIALDPLFIFGLKMGVQGAALATVISQTASAIWVMWFLVSGKGTLGLKKQYLRIRPKVVLSAMALGVSPFIMQSTESLVQVVFNTTLARYGGDQYVGAMVIMVSIMQFMLLPLQGFAQGAQPIIGYNYGAGDYGRVKTAIKYSTIFCVGAGLLLWSVAEFLPWLPVRVFTDDPAVVELTSSIIPLFFLGMVIFGFQMAFQQVFISLGQAKASVFIACLRKLILLIPLTMLLPRFITPPTLGVFLAEPIADFTAALTCCGLFAYKYRVLLCRPKKPEAEPVHINDADSASADLPTPPEKKG